MQSTSTSPTAETLSARATLPRKIRLAYFVSHPIQYQAPLLRRIAQEPDIDLTVFFSSDLSVRGYHDAGFGVKVEWDIPLLEGYKYEFLPRLRDGDTLGFAKPLNWGIFNRLRRNRPPPPPERADISRSLAPICKRSSLRRTRTLSIVSCRQLLKSL